MVGSRHQPRHAPCEGCRRRIDAGRDAVYDVRGVLPVGWESRQASSGDNRVGPAVRHRVKRAHGSAMVSLPSRAKSTSSSSCRCKSRKLVPMTFQWACLPWK